MARAAKKRKKEESEFTFPEFDEVDYMKGEVEGAKASMVTIAFAVPVALVSFALTLGGVPVVAFFLGLAAAFLLPRVFAFLPWPKVNIEKFQRKDWFGHGATFFFSWLAFWILLLNPPFGDQTPPTISGVSVNGTPVSLVQGTQVEVSSSNVTVNATIHENVALEEVVFEVNGSPQTPLSVGGARYTLQLQGSTSYSVTISARDTSGLTASFSFNVQVL